MCPNRIQNAWNKTNCLLFVVASTLGETWLYLQTTSASWWSQFKSQTGPRKPRLLIANTLPDSFPDPPCRTILRIMRNKVASLPLFYLVAQHSFQGGTHCCKPHLTKCFWTSWLFKFCKHIHLQHHQSRNNHHGCCRCNPADAPRPQCSAFHPWRKQEVWLPRNATRTTGVPLYIPAVCIVDYILDGFKVITFKV